MIIILSLLCSWFPCALAVPQYVLSSAKVPLFIRSHEMAAKSLSVWFLLSADPISKGPGDPALVRALQPQLSTDLELMEGEKQTGRSERELPFIPL